jgi:copper(I)-binding protein
MMRRIALGFLIALVSSAPIMAQDGSRVGELRIEGAWARATPPAARQGAAYLVIRNEGKAPDRLVAASAPVAEKAELHTHLDEGGVMRMRPVTVIKIEPGQSATLRPGGDHIMLVDLKAPLNEGERFPLTLQFERGGTAVIDVPIMRNAPAAHDGRRPAHGH